MTVRLTFGRRVKFSSAWQSKESFNSLETWIESHNSAWSSGPNALAMWIPLMSCRVLKIAPSGPELQPRRLLDNLTIHETISLTSVRF